MAKLFAQKEMLKLQLTGLNPTPMGNVPMVKVQNFAVKILNLNSVSQILQPAHLLVSNIKMDRSCKKIELMAHSHC
jgi:hypothetical protein